MMTNEAWGLGLSLFAGMLLGLFFFAGLWWTVRRGIASKRPARWFLGSMLLRTGVVMAGFYFIMGDSWQHLLTGLAGFSVARLIVTRWTRRIDEPARPAGEAGNAS